MGAAGKEGMIAGSIMMTDDSTTTNNNKDKPKHKRWTFGSSYLLTWSFLFVTTAVWIFHHCSNIEDMIVNVPARDSPVISSTTSTSRVMLYDDSAYFRRGRYLSLRRISRASNDKQQEVGIVEDKVKTRMLSEEDTVVIPDEVQNYILPDTLLHKLRNHDSIILEGGSDNNQNPKLVNILGRLNRFVETLDLVTGEQWDKRTQNVFDPAGHPVDDLNHVNAAVVDSLEPNGPKEIWLPCGFHNDKVNAEFSASFVRIINT